MTRETGMATPKDLERILKARRVVYKRVKMMMPHCPECKEQLTGNNSSILPYTCSCGEWESCGYNQPDYFKIKIKAL